MKSRLSWAVFVALVSVTVSSCGPKNHVDISLSGPWIFYVDNSKTFANRPVLIAMAPAMYDPTNPWPHQPPTVSNGEAYVIDDPNDHSYPPKGSQIYCLMFDGKCARGGASSLNADGYPAPNPVPARVPKGHNSWDWVAASKTQYGLTLILPVPDSYGSDTAWPMRFAPKFDVHGTGYGHGGTYSTGVVLRYNNGPARFDLNRCNNPKPTSDNCMDPANIAHTRLANNGTLHIEMKAPATNWSCDPHVRRVYPKMFALIGTPTNNPGPNAPYAVIDPAHNLNDDDSPAYDKYDIGHPFPPRPDPNNSYPSEYCLEHDWQGGYKDTRYVASGGGKDGMTVMDATHACAGDTPDWAVCVQQFVRSIPDNLELHCRPETDCDALREFEKALREIKADGSDLSFPRLAQLRRLDDNIAFLGQFNQEQLTNELDSEKLPADRSAPFLPTIFSILPSLERADDPYTKTHGDCAAPAMVLTDK